MTYSALFESLGWVESDFDLLEDDYTVFSHIRDPIDRHFRGTAEFIFKNKLDYLIDNVDWQKIWATAVLDIHSYPITWSLVSKQNKIVWIPIHPSFDTNKLTIDFLSEHGIYIEKINNLNENQTRRTKIYDKLKNLWTLIDKAQTLTYFYDADIVLWNKVLEQYQSQSANQNE